MVKYYTRACNFYFGQKSKRKISEGKALPLSNNHLISFDTIELISRKDKQKIHIREIKKQTYKIKQKIKEDIKLITPIKIGKSLKFNPLNFFFFVINSRSSVILFLILYFCFLISLIWIFFLSFLDIISIVSNDIKWLPPKGSALLSLIFFFDLGPK